MGPGDEAISVHLVIYGAPISCFLLVTPHTRCRLKLLKMERIKDFLLMEEELIRNQEQLRPQEKKNEVSTLSAFLHSNILHVLGVLLYGSIQ